MKNKKRWISLLLAMALILTAMSSMVVFAEGAASASQSTPSSDSTSEPTVPATPVPSSTPEPSATPAPSSTPAPSATPVPSQEPDSEVPAEPQFAAPYITSYNIYGLGATGNQDSVYNHYEKATVEITFVDEWAKENGGKITGRINTSAFRGYPVDAVGSDGLYTLTFTNVEFLGGSTNFEVELIYENPREIQHLEKNLVQCDDSWPEKAPEATPKPTAEPDIPKIIVKDYTFGDTSVQAGAEFTLDLTLFTTSGNTALEDVMVGLTFPAESKNISLSTGSMNTYVGKMSPGATRHITYKMVTDATMEPGSISINVEITSKNGANTTFPISIPVTQVERFEITNMEAPDTVMMGMEEYLSVTFVNKGKSPINNLSAEIMGDNLANPGQSQFLGNIAPGTENSVDFSIMPAGEGVIKGMILLTYEDAKGETQVLQKDFSCTVEAMPMMDDPGMGMPMPDEMVDGEPAGAGMPWWGWVLVVVGAAGVVVAVVIVVKKKKAKKQAALMEEEDEDF